MAKTIKFNLICDDYSIRTIEDLREHFSVEDLLKYYSNKLLHRWLKVRGYEVELEKIEEISDKNNLDIIKDLISIFEIETDKEIIEKNTYIFNYQIEEEISLNEYKESKFKTEQIIVDYHQGYNALISAIIENKNNMPKIKSLVNEMIKNYLYLFHLDYRRIFYSFYDNAPMAIFVLLMNKESRHYFMAENGNNEYYKDTDEIYQDLLKLNQFTKLQEILGDNMHIFAGATDSYWKDIEPKGKKYMILRMMSGNIVREANKQNGDLDDDAINGKFVILNGIDYKSNNASHKLLYLEV